MCCMWKYLRVNRRLSFCGCGKITHREWSGPSFSSEMSRDYKKEKQIIRVHTMYIYHLEWCDRGSCQLRYCKIRALPSLSSTHIVCLKRYYCHVT